MYAGSSLRLSKDGGSVAVEFALVSILVLMLIVALVGFAQVLQVRIAVTHAAREGARLAAVNKFDSGYVKTQAAQAGVSAADVVVSGPTLTSDAALGDFVEVSVSVPVDLDLLGVDWVMSKKTITVASSAKMRAEF